MMLDFFANFFSDPLNIIMVAIFVCIGVLIGLLFRPRAKDQVMKLIPRDRRFIDFNVAHEDAFSVECESVKGFPPQRFIKFRPGFTGKVGRFLKRAATRFLGMEGTAYTVRTESGPIEVGSLADGLRGIWGEDFYNTVPEEKRIALEESKVNIIVDVEPVLTPEGFTSVSEEDIKREQDRKAAETWWEGKKQSEKGKWIDYLFIAGFGFGVALALQILGILQI